MTEILHAPVPPSSLPYLEFCSGKLLMERQTPEPEDSPAAIEGRAAHWCNEMLWNTDAMTFGAMFETPFGVRISEEMREGADLWQRTLLSLAPRERWHLEERIDCPEISPDCWGTPDARAYVDGTIYIVDYKFGHLFVDAWENWQLIAYASGVMSKLRNDPQFATHLRVVLVIVQPRCYGHGEPVRKWEVPAPKLAPLIDKIRDRVLESVSVVLSRNTVNAGCRHCHARHNCIALQTTAEAAMDIVSMPTVLELPPQAVGVELRMLEDAQKAMEARISGLQEHAEALIRAGKPVPGYHMGNGRGSEVWKVPPEVLKGTEVAFGVKLFKEKPLTPNQARDVLKAAAIDPAVISAYSEKQSGALKLKRLDSDEVRKTFEG